MFVLFSDIEIAAPYQNRLCYNEGEPVYIECRGRLSNPAFSREASLTKIYVNIYFIRNVNPIKELLVLSVDLDTIWG